jgi:hypothetical protein
MQRHLHGPRALKCKENLTLTLGGSGERCASDAEASARVQDPEARKKVEDLKVQGTGDETLTLGGSGERRASSAKAAARVQDPEACTRAQGPEVQGTLEGAEAMVLSWASIASIQQAERSANVLELIREAGRKDAALKRQTGDSEGNVAEEFEVKNDLLFYEIDG